MTTLDCKRCGESKTLDQYGTFKNGTQKEGRRKICNFCRAQREKELRAADPDKYRARDKASYQQLKESGKSYEYHRKSYLMKTYGLTTERWDEIFESQGCACAICRDKETSLHWCVDHDHETGEVRGILCSPCNTLIGMAKDHPQVLGDAKRYLEERGYYGRYQPSLL